MTTFNASEFIRDYLNEARPVGRANELSWLELKREWYDMKTEDGKLEFLKDAAALANTGQDALLIVGVEDTSFAFYDQRIADSGYGDPSHFQSLIAARISPAFSLEVGELEFDDGSAKHALSFVHVPPTRNRPHLLTEWTQRARPAGSGGPPSTARAFENALFFRRGARTFGPTCDAAPTRTELDAMYFDRPARFAQIGIRSWLGKNAAASREQPHIRIKVPLVLENLGAIDTSVREIRIQGRLTIAASPPYCHAEQEVRIGDTIVTVAYFNGARFDAPIRLCAGESAGCHLELTMLETAWHGSEILQH
jgi:hypothetical protein